MNPQATAAATAPSYLAHLMDQNTLSKVQLGHRLDGIMGRDMLSLHKAASPTFVTFFSTANVLDILRTWYKQLGFVPCHYKLTMPQILAEMQLVYDWYGEYRFLNQTRVATVEELNAHTCERLTVKHGADVRWAASHKAVPGTAASVPQLHELIQDRPCPSRSDGGKDRSFPLAARLRMLDGDEAH